ncbi:MAG TPA: hypothetical protein VE954_07465 [Oligoflexus sp.]|uniref:hypothetical protein n=1 Tax=Oligoflexus sp. TaxID=1971216 RepID=UPI002D341EF7|nr:hypothetical protein [Oligoflexus sp.]HYX32937.1 hypothetical protein [Oligoflexus sp.]
MDRATASIREFARIIGVDHAAVSRAIKGGERLCKSVASEDGKPRIVIYDGCLEWQLNKDHRKDRRPDASPHVSQTSESEEMETIESNKVQRHYEALQAKISFEREAVNLTSIDKFKSEAFTAARATRDSLLYLPNESEREFKKLMTDFIRRNFGEERIAEFSKDFGELGLAFRVYQKASITKALRDMLCDRFGTLPLAKEADEQAPPT